METSSGLKSVFLRQPSGQQPGMWRPWTGNQALQQKAPPVFGDIFGSKSSKSPPVVHPVKLFWPKSRCFDYLYQDAELLLRCYPVQATICPYEEDSGSEEEEDEEEEEEEDEEEEEEEEKEQN